MMKTRYSGKHDSMRNEIFGTLMELMDSEQVEFIYKDDNYVLYRACTGEFKPSYSKRYKPTSYERRCIDKHKKSL